MAEPSDQDALSRKAAMYQQLTLVYPEDTRYPRRYAELLLQLGQDIKAKMVLDRLRKRFEELDRLDDAHALEQLQQLIGGTDETQPPATTSPLLPYTSNKSWPMFGEHPKQVEISEGSYLIHKGETDEHVYVLLEGELSIWLPGTDGKPATLVDILRKDQTVGEGAILDGAPRNADILANSDSILVKFTPKMITRLFLDHPEIEISVRNEHDIRQRMLMLSSTPIMTTVPATLRRTLAERAQTRRYKMFELITEAGKPIREVGFMISGKARRMTDDKEGNSHLFDSLKAGQMIANEAALLTGSVLGSDTFLTSIVAMEDCVVLTLPIDTFRQAMDAHPPLLAAMLRQASHSLTDTIQVINKINRNPPEK
ncbi:MAG TPA: cyclic nucleotide-binding domain-containing protein [Mariprofundaceae bacterium]|nr:cyclic nucleotide-binding domain-containing protein [Mariprofundaceae bacterium]